MATTTRSDTVLMTHTVEISNLVQSSGRYGGCHWFLAEKAYSEPGELRASKAEGKPRLQAGWAPSLEICLSDLFNVSLFLEITQYLRPAS